jgi:hypothetical protein
MKSLHHLLLGVALAAAAMLPTAALAQVPPHQPGTICFTPQFWCWMPYPGVPGQPCYCMTQWRQIPGVLG